MSQPDPEAAASAVTVADLDALAHRAIRLMRPGQRVILGITGSPGAGKTTVARRLVERLNEILADPQSPIERAAYLPMDGFHLANATLDRLGNHDRKGAIDTFDGWGFVALLGRLLVELDHPVYAPSFDRKVDEGIAAELVVLPDAEIVVVEGNYLLVDQEPWSAIPEMLAETWYCDTSSDERLRRLVDRHERYGRSPDAAKAWAESVDGVNAVLIEATRERADLVIPGG
ncbi:nucleoside/nucleotide kinase family protein [Diaminobutyricimonas sp. LJ205]|uniref:nucleoside/nucleotide kinase family protein n=1 Tax=Diaminobutyricimonas sp. LJ205 TaxID=2683590 RepID=UPI001E38EFCB|nr:nucleoside/nucleotide kinase family protein [Diaminobutyricimonas sp. LJ205]